MFEEILIFTEKRQKNILCNINSLMQLVTQSNKVLLITLKKLSGFTKLFLGYLPKST